jgi:hypothetical protein
MLFLAINSKKEIGYKPREYLDHQSVSASSKKMINFKMPFPPGKKFLDVPAKLVHKGHILCG